MKRYRLNLVIFLWGTVFSSIVLSIPLESGNLTTTTSPGATTSTSTATTTTPEEHESTTLASLDNATTTTPSPLSLATKVEDCNSTVCEEKICRIHRDSISGPSFYARCQRPHIESSVLLSSAEDTNNTSTESSQDLTKYCVCSSAYHVSAASDMHEQSYVTVTVPSNCQLPGPSQDKLCEQKVCQGDSKKLNKAAHICENEGKFYCACFN